MKVQTKVQKELDSLLAKDEWVTVSHRKQLPYTDATLHEIWRLGPVGPVAAIRCPDQDVKIGDYVIEKGSNKNF